MEARGNYWCWWYEKGYFGNVLACSEALGLFSCTARLWLISVTRPYSYLFLYILYSPKILFLVMCKFGTWHQWFLIFFPFLFSYEYIRLVYYWYTRYAFQRLWVLVKLILDIDGQIFWDCSVFSMEFEGFGGLDTTKSLYLRLYRPF